MGACTSKDGRQAVEPSAAGLPPTTMARKENPNNNNNIATQQQATALVTTTKVVGDDPKEIITPTTNCEEELHSNTDKHDLPSDEANSSPAAAASNNNEPTTPSKVGNTSADEEAWGDEEEAAANAKENSKEDESPAVGVDKNISQRRRRLSVSTVDAANAVQQIESNKAEADTKKAQKSKIVKFDDPALQLVDKNKGQVREVTLRMLKNLFPRSEHYAVFGSPSYHIQRGFDNKVQEIGGVMPPGKTLADIGVGFSCKKGLKPESPNQDDFFILKVDDWSMYGVFDGHGPCGHDVSAFVHKTLPFLVISDPEFETDTPAVLKRAFWRVHHLVEAAAEQPVSTLDCSLSGTTGTVIVQRKSTLYVAHVGDSRSVIAQKKGGEYVAHNLTNDHKPTNPDEKARIEASGGEVRRLEGDIPHRVFAVNRMYPGLAMSRAIGDTVGAAVGVTAEPDIRVLELTSKDKFFMLCSDGVWEFISSQQAVDIVCRKQKHQVQEAAETLAYEAWTRWVEEEENVVDDVTCIIVWNQWALEKNKSLKPSKTSGSSPNSKKQSSTAGK